MAHTLAGESEGGGHFFGRHLSAADAEEHFQHQALAVGEHLQGGVDVGGERFALHTAVGAGCAIVGHDVNHRVALIVLKRCIDTHLLTTGIQAVLDAVEVGVEQVGQLLGGGTALILLLKLGACTADFCLQTHLVEGHAHDAALFADGLQDALTNPPNGVGDELKAAGFVELLCGFHQADVALVDEVVERHALVLILLRHRHHKAQVGLHQAFECLFVAMADALCQFHLFVHGEEFQTANLGEIFVNRCITTIGNAL